MLRALCATIVLALALLPAPARAAQPDLPLDPRLDDMRAWIDRYSNDEGDLRRFYPLEISPQRQERMRAFLLDARRELAAVNFDALPRPQQVDYILIRTDIDAALGRLDHDASEFRRLSPMLPFTDQVLHFDALQRTLEPFDYADAARRLRALADSVSDAHSATRDRLKAQEEADTPADQPRITPELAYAASQQVDRLRRTLQDWVDYESAFNPEFDWWMSKPFESARDALNDYSKYLRESVAGVKGNDDDPLLGEPLGRQALIDEINSELLAYGPEELIAIGEAEFAWCEEQMRLAAAELGYDDPKEALEHVKGRYLPPGKQDEYVAELAHEAVAFCDDNDLVTISDLCRETWRIEMLSRQRQRFLPFAAYGGQSMLVAYPTGDMSHEEKLESLRGNNRHFTRIVTPHELIPGHHLQGFCADRFQTHRRRFSTPFYGEGWCLHWEMLLWDMNWAKSPEDRIGMLFWRMHRCARIIVSLKYHLEEMNTDEMIAFLTDRVGLEKSGATSEVRRYVSGGYGPLYQAGYMIGGLQIRALYKELVESGQMTARAFHDAVLQCNSIPIEMVRAELTDTPLSRDYAPQWRFAGEVPLDVE